MGKFDIIKKYYIDKHLKIFPLKANEKTPLITAWQNDCSNDFMQVVYWLDKVPDCNIGLPANENDLFILDVDIHGVNGVENFKRLCDDLEIEEPKTLIQRTPSGGLHYIFKSDDELKDVLNSANCFEDYKGLDLRTRGYIAVFPSKIKDKEYRFLNDFEPQEIPKKLKDFILKNAGTKKDTINKTYERPQHVDIGDRDNQMFLYINDLYFHTRLNEDEIRLLAEYFNESVFEKPLSTSVINYKIRKVFGKDRGNCIYVKLNE